MKHKTKWNHASKRFQSRNELKSNGKLIAKLTTKLID